MNNGGLDYETRMAHWGYDKTTIDSVTESSGEAREGDIVAENIFEVSREIEDQVIPILLNAEGYTHDTRDLRSGK